MNKISPSVLTEAVRLATMSPSLHNSQPWRFRVGTNTVEVYADRSRRLQVLDPAGRELLISVGAAVFTLRLALRNAGLRSRADLFPDPGEPDLVARVAPDTAHPSPPGPACEALMAAVPHRHTNRWPFARAAVPADAVEHLSDAARREGARLRMLSAVSRNAVLGLSQSADRLVRARPGYREELVRWAAAGAGRSDGVPGWAIGPWDALEVIPVRDFAKASSLPAPTEYFEPHPVLLVLATSRDEPSDHVRAGQALQRVLLTATWLDLATAPISQPIEIPEIRAKLGGAGDDWPAQMVLRIGYGRITTPTPRRPLDEVLLPDQRRDKSQNPPIPSAGFSRDAELPKS
ncbi:Acg family FMN-binding oxidoreductase [Actinoplanes solisilvae]|uniref:Acg family FMN-binding oxidoreductase n=1 Tax=Actinoplanes solisilvae TaxID=2486853 RepID=UPI000FD8EED0|nr:nitroreductase family protein [Actinoplanes solisilvae]